MTELSLAGVRLFVQRLVVVTERERVWWAGSDGRADGMAVGYWSSFVNN